MGWVIPATVPHKSGNRCKTLSRYPTWVYAVSFDPDGKRLATGSDGTTVILWLWDFDYLVKEGCNFIENYVIPNPDDEEALEIDIDLCKKF
ncbi:hypothetical protein [Microcoleus sp. Pol11C3]|uniref:hypothetical protein n=1 Tax=Microcoleus sp. Pol11C3 TaxID=3055390 RepID=UPI002FD3D500